MMAQKCAIPVIGLIGGVGSGKSFVARELASRRPVEVIVADQIGHDVLRCPDIKTAIRREFGEGVFDSQGEVDRPAMSAQVFGSDPQASARRSRLESIVHPGITREVQRRIEQANDLGKAQAVVVDAPLLLEAGWQTLCDGVVYVDCPDEIRRRRVLEQRQWSEAELARREASQWSLARKRGAADLVIDNAAGNRAVDELERFLDKMLSDRRDASLDGRN